MLTQKRIKELERRANRHFARQDFVSYLIPIVMITLIEVVMTFQWQQIVMWWFSSLVFFFSFWTIRIAFGENNTYHSKSWKTCKIITRLGLICGVLVLRLLPPTITVSWSVFIAFLCALALYGARVAVDRYEERIKEASKPIEKKFHTDTATAEEILERVKQVYKKDTEYFLKQANVHFINVKSHEEINKAYPESSRKERMRMKAKLNK